MAMKTEWQWTDSRPIPERVMVVASCTKYTEQGWENFNSVLTPAYFKFLESYEVLGLAVYLDETNRCSWGVSAWPNYEALEHFVLDQIKWLRETVDQLDLNNEYISRHNAYRMMNTTDLPLSWDRVQEIVQNVMDISPLGADAFPELSKMLGITTGE